MEPEDFRSSTRTPPPARTTWARRARRRRSTTAARWSRLPARSPSSCASWRPTTSRPTAADIVLADGHGQRRRPPRAGVSIAELAGIASGGELLIGHGSGAPAAAPTLRGSSCVGGVGMAVVRRAAVLLPRGARPARPRHRRRARARGRRGARLGHDHQPDRRPRPGPGRRDDGHRPGAHRRARATTTKAASATRPARVQAADVRRRARRSRRSSSQIATPDAGPQGAKGLAEPPNVPTRGGDLQRHRQAGRAARAPAADDRRARVGGDGAGDTSRSRATLDEALAAVAAARDRSPAAPTSWSAPGRARRRCPTASSPSIASTSSPASTTAGGGLRIGALVAPRRHRGPPRDRASATRRWPTPLRSSARTPRATSARSAAT